MAVLCMRWFNMYKTLNPHFSTLHGAKMYYMCDMLVLHLSFQALRENFSSAYSLTPKLPFD